MSDEEVLDSLRGPQGEQGPAGEDGEVINTDSLNIIIMPIVRTVSTYSHNEDSVLVYGQILYPGNDLSNTEIGVMFGTDTAQMEESTIQYSGQFDYIIVLDNLAPNTRYYVAAIGRNNAGRNRGEILSFVTPYSYEEPQSCPEAPTVTDHEGNVYQTVKIGSLCWMKEDLRTTHYPDGSEIYYGRGTINSFSNTSAANYTIADNGSIMYNFAAASNHAIFNPDNDDIVQGICPDGWHLPSREEWSTLFETTGGIGTNENTVYTFENIDIFFDENSSGIEGTNITGFSIMDEIRHHSSYQFSPSQFPTSQNRHSGIASAGPPYYQRVLICNGGFYDWNYAYVRCVKGQGIGYAPKAFIDTTITYPYTDNTTARLYYYVKNAGTAITQQGLCYSTSPNPTTSDNIEQGDVMHSLEPNTTYYVRAFATNSYGTGYSEETSFTTRPIMNQPCPDAPTVTDYEGNVYQTVQIGTQCWMKENLRSRITSTGNFLFEESSLTSPLTPSLRVNEYDDNTLEYNYAAATNSAPLDHNDSDHIQGICPDGWHIPTYEEWVTLALTVGGEPIGSTDGVGDTRFRFEDPGVLRENGSNTSGFSGTMYCYFSSLIRGNRPTGFNFWSDNSDFVDICGRYWSTNTYYQVRCIKGEGIGYAPIVILDTNIFYPLESSTAASVHYTVYDAGGEITQSGVCWSTSPHPTIADNIGDWVLTNLEPNTTYYVRAFGTNQYGTRYSEEEISFTTLPIMNQPCPDAPTVTDYEGNVYQTVQIGTQCWMKENLRSRITSTGNFLFEESSLTSPLTPSLRVNEYDDNTLEYNYAAATNSAPLDHNDSDHIQGICPDGWHIPTYEEWVTLALTVGGEPIGSTDGVGDTRFRFEDPGVLRENGSNTSGFSGTMYCYFSSLIRGNRPTGFNFWSDNSDFVDICGRYWSTNTYYQVRCIKGEGIGYAPIVILDTNIFYPLESSTAASVHYTVYDAGGEITQSGVCWSTSPHPTIADNIGDWVLTNLEPNTTYYVRAFGTNQYGTRYSEEEISFTTLPIMNQPCPDASTVTDIDGNVYQTVQMGEHCWMKENLRTLTLPNGMPLTLAQQQNGNSIRDRIPQYYTRNNEVLYNAYGARNGINYEDIPIQGICPNGWHLPTTAEFNALMELAEYDVNQLKSTEGWATLGSNITGFNALPSYYVILTDMYTENNTLTLYSSKNLYNFKMTNNTINMEGGGNFLLRNVRCVKGEGEPTFPSIHISAAYDITASSAKVQVVGLDGNRDFNGMAVHVTTGSFPAISTHTINTLGFSEVLLDNLEGSTTYYIVAQIITNNTDTITSGAITFTTLAPEVNTTCPDAPYVTDIDGNVYNTVLIGNQCWMKENLRTTRYANAVEISDVRSPEEFQVGTSVDYGKYYKFSDITNGAPSYYNGAIQGVCPNGWHVPSLAEFQTLLATAGTISDNPSAALAENGQFWQSGDATLTNTTGFSARPAGTFFDGYLVDDTGMGNWVTHIDRMGSSFVMSSIDDTNNIFYTLNGYIGPYGIEISTSQTEKEDNYVSVRCIKGEGATDIPLVVESIEMQDMGAYIVIGGANYGNSTVSFNVYLGTSEDNMELLPSERYAGWSFWNDDGTSSLGVGIYQYNPNTPTASEIWLTPGIYYFKVCAALYGINQWKCTNTEMLIIPGPDGETLASVNTGAISEITHNSAICGGTVTEDGGATVTARGVCWSTSPNPTINDNHTTNGTGTGNFTSNITTLIPSTTYYVRAYATNNIGTVYGDEVTFTTSENPDGKPCPGAPTVTDADGNVYNTVLIGEQCWMKENLRTTRYTNGTAIPLGTDTSSEVALRYYPNGNSNNVAEYGFFYNWSAVMNGSASSEANPSGVQGICPDGWHVPSDAEWTELTDYVSSQSQYVCDNIAKALASEEGWNSSTDNCAIGNNPSANNATGFSARPAGSYEGNDYGGFGNSANFWSATQNNSNNNFAYRRNLSYYNDIVFRGTISKRSGLSVRCVRNEVGSGSEGGGDNEDGDDNDTTVTAQPCPGAPTVTDVDGNVYNTVQIGEQCWMRENLKTTKYANGTTIPLGTETSYEVAYRYYPNGNSNNVAEYGFLYNWSAVMNGSASSDANPSGVQGICPTGWHVPSDAEWTELENYVSSQSQYVCGGDEDNIAKVLASKEGWNSSTDNCAIGNNPSANNAAGFSARPAGNYYGSYTNFGSLANFWSATQGNSNYAYYRYLDYNFAYVFRNGNNKGNGYSVRCVRNEEGSGSEGGGDNEDGDDNDTTVTAQPCPGAPTVTDVDGNVYNTVQIGEQCWMRENLKTTKYANGTTIPLGTEESYDVAYRYYPNGNSANVSDYGYLYNWAAVMNGSASSEANPSGVQGICPDGWHVPSDAEWTELTDYVSSQSQYVCGGVEDYIYIAKALASEEGWNSSTDNCDVGNNPSANNATGFSARPADGYYDGNYLDFGGEANFWGATQYGINSSFFIVLDYHRANVGFGTGYEGFGLSVRCVRN